MNIKKYLPYLGALVAAILALLALMSALKGHTDTPASWDALSASVKQVGSAADLTSATAITNKDKAICIVSKSASGLAGGVAESVTAVKSGTCRIPDVNVDVTACLWDAPVAPAVLPVPASEGDAAVTAVVVVDPTVVAAPAVDAVVTAPAAPADETVVAPATAAVATPAAVTGTDVPAAVELAVGPLVALVQSTISASDVSPTTKAWGTGVLAWIDSGRPSIIALVENPAEGKLSFKGVDIAGCTP